MATPINPLFEELEEVPDKIKYWLFPHDEEGNSIQDVGTLENLKLEYLAHLTPLINNYIWNNDRFTLQVSHKSSDSDPIGPYIYGQIIVGDYIEDEWFVVYLLKFLSQEYPRLVCRVVDNDGEFLLVEAAEHLAKWVSPSTAEQRVYLKKGKVHLVSPHSAPSSGKSSLAVMDAVAAVNAKPSETLANPAIQKAIDLKIQDYPGKISKDQHIAHAYVPVGVAALLREYPTLVAQSVRAFCKRDEKDTKILKVMRHFPPEQRVLTAVRFSKALYAQLSAYSYTPDRLTGWNLPSTSHRSYKSHLLGMKLACGFEILVCQAGGVTPLTPSSEAEFDGLSNDENNLDSNIKWTKYKESLTHKGYFRGESENSKLYADLEENARRFFLSNITLASKNDESTDVLSSGAAIVKLLSKVNTDYDFYKERESRLTPPDDENWLQITPESLDSFMENNYGLKSSKSGNSEKTEQEMMESLNSFLSNIPEAEEGDIPPELRDPGRKLSVPQGKPTYSHSRKASSGGQKISNLLHNRKISSQSNASEGSNVSEMSSFSNKIDFNADAFSDALNNILELSLPEDDYWRNSDEDSSGMSSYEEEDDELSLSRKTSNGSQDSEASKASSGVGHERMDPYVRALEKELKAAKKKVKEANPAGCKPKKRGQRIPLADLGDEFEDVDNFNPVGIDMQEVKELMKNFSVSGDPSQLGSFGSSSLHSQSESKN